MLIEEGDVVGRVLHDELGHTQLFLCPVTLGDIAKTPHPADNLILDTLLHRVALEYPPIPEMQHIETAFLGAGIE